MFFSKFGSARWVLAAFMLPGLQGCAEADQAATGTSGSAFYDRDGGTSGGASSFGESGNWSGGAATNGAGAFGAGGSSAGGSNAGGATSTNAAQGSGAAAGAPSSVASTDAGAASGPQCSVTDLGNLLAANDAGASVMLNCLLTTCLLDVIGQVGPCLSQCMQTQAGLSRPCGDCVGAQLQSARDQCLKQCADDFECYGDCALTALGNAGAACAL